MVVGKHGILRYCSLGVKSLSKACALRAQQKDTLDYVGLGAVLNCRLAPSKDLSVSTLLNLVLLVFSCCVVLERFEMGVVTLLDFLESRIIGAPGESQHLYCAFKLL